MRKDRNLTQESLAAKAGIDIRTYNRIENNQNQPSIETIVALCKVLSCSSDELLGLKPMAEPDVAVIRMSKIITEQQSKLEGLERVPPDVFVGLKKYSRDWDWVRGVLGLIAEIDIEAEKEARKKKDAPLKRPKDS